MAYFYPNLRELLLSGMEIAEPPGQSFHYTDRNTLLLGVILERVGGRVRNRARSMGIDKLECVTMFNDLSNATKDCR